MMRTLTRLAIALSMLCSPIYAQLDEISSEFMPPCVNGDPWIVTVVDATNAADCDSTPSGTAEAICICLDGTIAPLGSGGGSSNSFETINVPSGGDPVADSATDTLNYACDSPFSCTGVALTDTITFNFGTQTANTVFAGPVSGSAAAPTFRALVSADGKRRYSWDNPPTSPHAYDDEFDSGTLDAKWTVTSAGTTNPAVAGTIDYTASLTTPIVDAATIPGWVAFQCDNSSLKSFGIEQTVSIATDATFFFKMGGQTRDPSTSAEGDFYFSLWNSGDLNEWIHVGVSRNTATGGALAQMSNNGAMTTNYSTDFNNWSPVPAYYLAIWKKSNVYYFGSANVNGIFTLLGGAMTKTGVTTFDRLGIGYFSTSANETPSVIDGVDFFRYKASLDYSLMHP